MAHRTRIRERATRATIGGKTCNRCGSCYSDPATAFARDRSKPDGFYTICKRCRAAYARGYRQANVEKLKAEKRLYHERNRDAALAKNRERYSRDPEKTKRRAAERYQRERSARIADTRRWYRENRERASVAARAYAEQHRESRRSYSREYRKRRPDVMRAGMQRRKARARNAPGTCSAAQLEARIAYYGRQCWMCGGDFEAIDHVIPLARGGSGWPANLRPACHRCNRRKGSRKPSELRPAA